MVYINKNDQHLWKSFLLL